MLNVLNYIIGRFNFKIKRLYIFCSSLIAFGTAINIALPLIQKKLFETIETNRISVFHALILLLSGVLGSLITLLIAYYSNKLFYKYKHTLQTELIEQVRIIDNKKIDFRGAGGFMTGIFGDSDTMASFINMDYPVFIFSVINVIVILIISISWTSLLVLLIPIIYTLSLIVIILTAKKQSKTFALGREEVMILNPKLMAYIQNRRSVQQSGVVYKFEDEIEKHMSRRDSFFEKSGLYGLLSSAGIESIRVAFYILVVFLLAFEIFNGTTSFSTLVAVSAFYPQIFAPLTSLQRILQNDTKFNVFSKKIEFDQKKEMTKIKIPESSIFELKGISFAHENKEIIKDISFKISSDVIGIVGLSGEGKSTIIKILTGDYNATEGICSFGNVPVGAVPKPVLYNQVAIYSQEIEIFNKDLCENICLGKSIISGNELIKKYDEALINLRNEIQNYKNLYKSHKKISLNAFKDFPILLNIFACKRFSEHKKEDVINIYNQILLLTEQQLEIMAKAYINSIFISKTVYENVLNDVEIKHLQNRDLGDSGANLSGGERQKVAFARFLVKKNTDLFVLDEPFANLDSITETKYLNILKDNISGRSGVIISHKLNILKACCSKIIVIENGTITAVGKSDELYNTSSIYKELINSFNGNKVMVTE